MKIINKIVLICILITASFLSYAQSYGNAGEAVKSKPKAGSAQSVVLPEIALAPFMVGLTAEALISDYEWSITQGKVADTRIPAALKAIADHLMVAEVRSGPNAGASMWVENFDNSGYGTFRYQDTGVSGTNPAPVLNLLIAPMYAWLYKHYGETVYLEMGDKIFIGGVRLAEGSLDWAGKQYNQNYRWSFDYVRWRNEGPDLDLIFAGGFE